MCSFIAVLKIISLQAFRHVLCLLQTIILSALGDVFVYCAVLCYAMLCMDKDI